ncbi:exodeoxyribonuclease VII large subunit [Candidatus Curtissbacteria bacterium RIFCSPLOWO2_01_FULL_39_62]|uniref:Exodeoxyribonuclease 7 large subunit n=1 Tax=Candidatus Curtissbacteria bacterium RIFCSPHIGHO2_02_FULL_40_16b TaxID=1797714 RepID=A0A1F5G817_9BACT|nr:MAG: exodeoxyribonuclease VII large subunit [Candidatus Curtissbacteria bacterium RIFCSPHIGHO2_01_FULL_39_57]OGD87989.1 MAG: exodeoxyribonuclease VII large subunit [Candidatus Curtissbacteria bacterium RIFCSPHIGHO2_02_FULL_40_16b]OGE02296.1 MAG: exodeoxyribonuclease VII large subunit [Candidatus Curtissbacteria bacterium RIFCSPLOWO2_01_FULL_39_62]
MRIIEGKNVFSVTEVNSIARKTLEQINFWVEGELSSFKDYNPKYRYLYFDLKDPQTGFKLPCILDPEIYLSENYQFEDGVKVLALGTLTLWEKEAKLQMHVLKMKDFGEGFLLAEFEKLKEKLQKKGYFDEKNKKELPDYPTRVAVISSRLSDALQDFKKHSHERFPALKLTLYDVKVQGFESAQQIRKALTTADKEKFDAIVLVRGGGSVEDLASFNDEKLASAIFNASTPVIVGVGHEKDVTIASLTADVAASTPTDAAKILTENYVKLEQKLSDLKLRAQKAMRSILWNKSQELDFIYQKLISSKDKFIYLPQNLILLRKSLLTTVSGFLEKSEHKLNRYKNSLLVNWKSQKLRNQGFLDSYLDKLMLVSPKNVLSRGYSIVTNSQGNVVKDAAIVDIGEKVKVKLARGRISTKIIKKSN